METLRMSWRERRRLETLSRVREQSLSLVEAAELLGVGYRQAQRLWRRYQEEGDEGLVHKLRGRPSNRQAVAGLRERALELVQQKYADYGPTLAAECLASEDALSVPASTLRRWMHASGLWSDKRRRKAHRRRRARRLRRGELVQMDGSRHDWFEGRRGWATLMVMIDDATGAIYARFFEAETLAASQETFRRYVDRNGLPRAAYVDKAGIYRADREPTSDELVAGTQPRTQFGRAMDELGVELILANSPQAKGRVERMNGTLQDRLVKALRRAGISDLAVANAFLESAFLAEFNAKFARPPAEEQDAHRRPEMDLDLALSVVESRVVQNDWTVRWNNRFLQLPMATAEHVQPGQSVEVREQLDGRLRLFADGRELAWEEAMRVERRRPRRPQRSAPTGSSQGRKPDATHPWRGAYKGQEGEAAAGGGCCVAPAR